MVVRMRHNRSQTANRRSHHALKAATMATCANCSALHRPHHMCLSCGFYKGRQVMDLAGEKAKRLARIKANKERARADLSSAAAPAVNAAAPAHDHDHAHDEHAGHDHDHPHTHGSEKGEK